MTEIRVPTLGESVTEATIGKWFKKPGDAVAVDEPLVELETDKVTIEVPAPAAGVSRRRSRQRTARPSRSARCSARSRKVRAPPQPRHDRRARQEAEHARRRSRLAPTRVKPRAQDKPEAQTPKPAADMPVPPSVRKIGAESGVDPSTVAGTGKDGRVTKGDMMAAIERAASAPTPVQSPAAAVQVRAPSPADDAAREERVKMTRLRQTIARRLKEAQNTAAMLTTFNEVDMTAVMEMRNQYKDAFEKKHGVKLGFMGFFVRACVQALKEIPAVNAEIDGNDIVYKNYYHIGVAVGTEKGLVVPVMRDCDHKSLAEIEKDIADRRQARARRPAQDRRHAGRHLHHLQWRRLRLADVDADPERAAIGHSRHAQDPGAAGRDRRQGRDPADDVSRALLRSPHRRRPRGGDLPGAGEGSAGRSGAAGAGSVIFPPSCAGLVPAIPLDFGKDVDALHKPG